MTGAAFLHHDRGDGGVQGARFEEPLDDHRQDPGIEIIDVALDDDVVGLTDLGGLGENADKGAQNVGQTGRSMVPPPMPTASTVMAGMLRKLFAKVVTNAAPVGVTVSPSTPAGWTGTPGAWPPPPVPAVAWFRGRSRRCRCPWEGSSRRPRPPPVDPGPGRRR